MKGQAPSDDVCRPKLVLGAGVSKTATYLERCRRKRNELSYDMAGVVTDTEATRFLFRLQRSKTL